MPTATRSSPDVRQSAQPKSVWYERLTKAAAYSLPEIPIILAALIYTNSRGLQRSLGAIAFYYPRSEEHTSELQSQSNLVCRLLLEKKKKHHVCCTKHAVIRDLSCATSPDAP